MKIIAVDSYGETPSIREVANPGALEGDELLVHVHAAGVNPVDVFIAKGYLNERVQARFPLTLGLDFAGVIENTGLKVSNFKIGDRVYGKLVEDVLHQGSYGEYITVSEDGCISKIPGNLNFVEAAAFPTPAMTALVSIDAAGIKKGSAILINGATGGVGSFAVQMASRLGAYVIATAHGDGIDYLTGRGASEVINYKEVKLEDEVKREFPDGIDALLDLASDRDRIEELSRLVRKGGAVVSTRHAADVDEMTSRELHPTNISVPSTGELLSRVSKGIASGDLTPPLIKTYSIVQVNEALNVVSAGHVHGKLVLQLLP